MSDSPGFRRASALSLALAGMIVVAGTVAMAVHAVAILSEPELATQFMSHESWQQIVSALRGGLSAKSEGTLAEVPLAPGLEGTALFSLVSWLGGAGWIARRRHVSFAAALCRWGAHGWLWWLLPLAWEIGNAIFEVVGWQSVRDVWRGALPFWESLQWAGWLTHLCVLAEFPAIRAAAPGQPQRVPKLVWGAMLAYFLCFGVMNWQLYQGLLVPHGDTAMYEEHIWNLLHGKGFRSYLDEGRLFLGEHIQVIHLLAIPLYVFWPSHLLLELCQSAALALGAIPVFRMAQRHSGSSSAGTLLALAYLLYFPMQYLDIAADFKTFRPNSFEIPLFLMALDALERGRYRTLLVWLGMTLLCQEDAAVVIAPLGVWIALRQGGGAAGTNGGQHPGRGGEGRDAGRWQSVALGAGLALFGVAYTAAVIKIVLPWFRGGADVHFAQYFADLGATSGEITRNLLRHPELLLAKLGGAESVIFAIALLAPLGFLPLLSPGRLAVAAPLFGVLCLSEITNSPLHHFHAPMVPVLFWAGAAGLASAPKVCSFCARWFRRWRAPEGASENRGQLSSDQFIPSERSLPVVGQAAPAATAARARGRVACMTLAAAVWVFFNSAFCGAPYTFSPAGIGFWDPHSRIYWRKLYVPGERARRFPAVLARIPRDSRVASTDYIHPRFTHHERSYDSSLYRREVPADTDYIVIDTQHPYSQIKRPDETDEMRRDPEKWEVLDDQTGGYFIILKRRH